MYIPLAERITSISLKWSGSNRTQYTLVLSCYPYLFLSGWMYTSFHFQDNRHAKEIKSENQIVQKKIKNYQESTICESELANFDNEGYQLYLVLLTKHDRDIFVLFHKLMHIPVCQGNRTLAANKHDMVVLPFHSNSKN